MPRTIEEKIVEVNKRLEELHGEGVIKLAQRVRSYRYSGTAIDVLYAQQNGHAVQLSVGNGSWSVQRWVDEANGYVARAIRHQHREELRAAHDERHADEVQRDCPACEEQARLQRNAALMQSHQGRSLVLQIERTISQFRDAARDLEYELPKLAEDAAGDRSNVYRAQRGMKIADGVYAAIKGIVWNTRPELIARYARGFDKLAEEMLDAAAEQQ